MFRITWCIAHSYLWLSSALALLMLCCSVVSTITDKTSMPPLTEYWKCLKMSDVFIFRSRRPWTDFLSMGFLYFRNRSHADERFNPITPQSLVCLLSGRDCGIDGGGGGGGTSNKVGKQIY